ncbi:MAG: Hint domain-containing protein [Sedimentitalea sp.]
MAELRTDMGGDEGYGKNAFTSTQKEVGDDDNGAIQIQIKPAFGSNGVSLFGEDFKYIYVNSNGAITFGEASSSLDDAGAGDFDMPALLPFYSDMNLNAGGEIYWDVSPQGDIVTITWSNVAPYDGSGSNTFQVELKALDSGELGVTFTYGDMEWGESGTNPAFVGITDGAGQVYTLNGSGDTGALESLDTAELVEGGTPGVFTFETVNGVPEMMNTSGSGDNDVIDLSGQSLLNGALNTIDDEIDGGDGDDVIHGGVGNDTILGGSGLDTLRSGTENQDDSIPWQDVSAGSVADGSTSTDYFRWVATDNSFTTIKLNQSAAAADGDGLADYILIDSDADNATLRIGDLEPQIDKIILTEPVADLTQGYTTTGYTQATVTYANGNQQFFQIYHEDKIDLNTVFTTQMPTYTIADDDILSGGEDGDTFEIETASGDDTLTGGETGTGDDIVDLSGVNNALSVTYSQAEAGEISSGDNTLDFSEIEALKLSEHSDFVDGGADTSGLNIEAGQGDDSIKGGSGNDTLEGGDGDDLIDGGVGDDLLRTGIGDDTLRGGEGNDTLMNSAGDDSLSGGVGNDSIVATQGNDTLDGGEGDDTLLGGSDDDSLVGGAGTDQMFGGTGHDILEGGSGADVLIGDGVSDVTLSIGGSDRNDVNPEFEVYADGVLVHTGEVTWAQDGGAAFDPAAPGAFQDVIVALPGGVPDTLEVRFVNDFDPGDSGADAGDRNLHLDSITVGDVVLEAETEAAVTGAVVSGDDVALFGTGSNATFDISDLARGADTMSGGDDADQFVLGDRFGNDQITGGEGGVDSDTIDGAALSDDVNVVFTGAEAGTLSDGADIATFSQVEAIVTGGGSDVVNASADTAGLELSTGAGQDTITGGSGADEINAGDDADDILVEDGFGADTIAGGEGGDDDDALRLSALTEGVDVTITAQEAGQVVNSSGTLTFSEIEKLELTDQGDTLDASSQSAGVQGDGRDGDDLITGGAGDDIFAGGAGGDTISGGAGSDYIDGGAGDDLLMTGTGDDTLIGGAGNDTLMNSSGDDSLVGGTGDDSIIATDGNDTLEGGTGDDTLDGGADDDSLEGGSGADLLKGGSGDDVVQGGDDSDTIVFEDGFGNDTVSGGEGGTDWDVLDFSAVTGPVTVTYKGDEAGSITDGVDTVEFSEIEGLILSSKADVVDATADSAGIHVESGDGSDTITGGSGDDTIYYGDGNNSVTSGDGDDYIDDEAGNPGFIGSNKIDAGKGNDTVFSGDGDDSIAGGDGDDVINSQRGNDSVDGGAGNDLLISEIGNATLDGGAGDDTIDAGIGNSSITGGTGDDTFIYEAGDGVDTISDFNTGNSGTLNDGDATNNDFIDLSGFYDHLGELHADQADDGILNQSNDGVSGAEYSDNDKFGTGGLTFEGATADSAFYTAENTGVVCFGQDTQIATLHGQRRIQDLQKGDLVVTRDNGVMPVLWIGRCRIGAQELALSPRLRPVFLAPDLIGADRPLVVSPQHAVLLRKDGEEVLVRATHLVRTRGGQARIAQGRNEITYFHLLFETHQIIFANGAPTESLYLGTEAVKALRPAARCEVASLFPDLFVARGGVRQLCPARMTLPRIELPDHLAGFAPAG